MIKIIIYFFWNNLVTKSCSLKKLFSGKQYLTWLILGFERSFSVMLTFFIYFVWKKSSDTRFLINGVPKFKDWNNNAVKISYSNLRKIRSISFWKSWKWRNSINSSIFLTNIRIWKIIYDIKCILVKFCVIFGY